VRVRSSLTTGCLAQSSLAAAAARVVSDTLEATREAAARGATTRAVQALGRASGDPGKGRDRVRHALRGALLTEQSAGPGRLLHSAPMTDMIRDIFLDMPIVDMPNRPEGMVAFMRSEVPDQYKPMVDEWVQGRGGEVVVIPLIQVHGGKSPESSPESDGYYVLPPSALA